MKQERKPRLIVINGAAGTGKSTAAKNVHEKLHMSFLIDVDAQRENISHFRDDLEKSNNLLFSFVSDMARSWLQKGFDVIIERMFFNEPMPILDEFRSIAGECGAEIHEFILWMPLEPTAARANARGYRPNGLLTPEKVENFWERMNLLKDGRPEAKVIDITELDPDQVAAKLMESMQE